MKKLICPDQDREEGAALILALAFVLAVSLIVVALATLATGSMTTAINLKAQRTAGEDAQTAVTVAIQWVRYDYIYDSAATTAIYTTTAEPCLPTGATLMSSNPQTTTTNPVTVFCTGAVNPFSIATRTVYFSACPGSSLTVACSSSASLLNAEVTFDDQNSDGQTQCNLTTSSTCGTAVDVVYWDVTNADT